MNPAFVLQLASTLFLTGVVWFVQVVHYPLFARVGAEGFPAYERVHAQLTTWVVAPVMLVEIGTAFWLLAFPSREIPRRGLWVGFVLLVGIWASTFLLQVPEHAALERGFDADTHQRLVSTNWIRTVLWTGRSLILLAILRQGGDRRRRPPRGS